MVRHFERVRNADNEVVARLRMSAQNTCMHSMHTNSRGSGSMPPQNLETISLSDIEFEGNFTC